jgi:ABC-type microcin C transport system permease subunit YejB
MTTISFFGIQIRPGGEIKQRLRVITYDVANEFDVRGAVDPRPVPYSVRAVQHRQRTTSEARCQGHFSG